jgi:hypothetical protein
MAGMRAVNIHTSPHMKGCLINRLLIRIKKGNIMLKIFLAIFLLCLLTGCGKEEPMINREDRRITIEGNYFMAGGKRIWMNGTNTPWNKWNDFGGAYNDGWWDDHFAKLREAGVNSVRVWINCNNDNRAILIEDDGMITGVSEKHWADLDLFFETAERNQLYIMATLLSFDHFQDRGARPVNAQRWRNMITGRDTAHSFAENYVIPFVQRYGDNPWLWSIDLCNEPDWIHENEVCGQLAWEDISYLFAVCAAAIREHSDILVTVGMSFPKYNADGSRYEGNKVSDAFLQSLYDNPNAYLDFWSPHYYDWVGPHYGVPFYINPAAYGMCPSKPSLIGESPAVGSAGKTLIEDYENAMLNGWQGVMPWTSNGVDGNGGFNELAPATRYMAEKYRKLIFPLDE